MRIHHDDSSEILNSINSLRYPMPKYDETEVLLKEHEELVSLFVHESKIKWNLISVYVALSVGLVSAVGVLIQREEIYRIGAVSFLCLMGSLFSFAGALLLQRNQQRTSKWVEEGIRVEKALEEKALTLQLFEICKSLLKRELKILRGMCVLAIFWLIVAIAMMLSGMGLINLPFFP